MFFVLIWPLLGLLMFAFLPWQIALPLWLIILGLSLFFSWRNMRSQERVPSVTGRKAMVGGRGVVIEVDGLKVEVDYRGELWQAVSDEPLFPGQEVMIMSIEGLILNVIPDPGGARDDWSIGSDDPRRSGEESTP